MPQARTRGNWTEHAPMPAPAQSELAATRSGTDLYVLGGYGDPRGFKRYDTVLDRWARLPDLPAGRDHLAAFVLADAVWYSGGEPNGDGDQLQPGFRYDIASATWTPAPVLRPGFGSHAAVLFGRAYIGSEDGSLQEFDPRQGAARTIRPAGSIARDHSQVVAFLGEIWMIAGRAPETTSVSIYDPITERWRFGPPLGRARGGFAAAVLGQQIVVAGGEVLGGGTRLERSLEVYAAGADGWVFGPELPLAVHGVGGAAVGTRFYLLGGSTRAGSASFGSQRTFSVDLQP
jgi:hypothetical protein